MYCKVTFTTKEKDGTIFTTELCVNPLIKVEHEQLEIYLKQMLGK
jgi:hypothetical protein